MDSPHPTIYIFIGLFIACLPPLLCMPWEQRTFSVSSLLYPRAEASKWWPPDQSGLSPIRVNKVLGGHDYTHSFIMVVYGCFCAYKDMTAELQQRLYDPQGLEHLPPGTLQRSLLIPALRPRILSGHMIGVLNTLVQQMNEWKGKETKRWGQEISSQNGICICY